MSATVVLCWGGGEARAADPTPNSPELRVLDRFVGTWEGQSATARAQWTPKPSESKGSVNTIRWTLNGQYLEDRGRNPDKSEYLGVWTYDPRLKIYRVWYFLPGAIVLQFPAQWNESAQAFKGTVDIGNGVTMTTTHRFVSKDAYEWSYVAKDRSGKLYLDMQGRHRRKQ